MDEKETKALVEARITQFLCEDAVQHHTFLQLQDQIFGELVKLDPEIQRRVEEAIIRALDVERKILIGNLAEQIEALTADVEDLKENLLGVIEILADNSLVDGRKARTKGGLSSTL